MVEPLIVVVAEPLVKVTTLAAETPKYSSEALSFKLKASSASKVIVKSSPEVKAMDL